MSLRLRLHVGHGKTGSSFIQSWLAANAILLLKHQKVFYPQTCPNTRFFDVRARHAQFSMGNGFVLNSVLNEGVSWQCQQRWWYRLCHQNRLDPKQLDSLVFSHEPWARKLPTNFPRLLQLSKVLDASCIDIWLLVRDPLDHAISVYGQMVKRHGFSGSLDEWLNIYDFPKVLMSFLNVIDHSDMNLFLRVDHFDRHRRDLTDCLKQWLSISNEISWEQVSQSVVNRSLTKSELIMMRWLNARDAELALKTGEKLIQRLPLLKGSNVIASPKSVHKFVRKWKPLVEELNYQLPAQAQLNLPNDDEISVNQALKSGSSHCRESATLTEDQFNCLLDALGMGES